MPHLPRSVNLEFMVTDLARGAAYYGDGREFGLREGNKLDSTPYKFYNTPYKLYRWVRCYHRCRS